MMKRLFTWALICATALFAACNGNDTPDGPAWPAPEAVSVSISGSTVNYVTATVKVNNTSAEALAYIVDQQANMEYTAETIFAEGTTIACKANISLIINLSQLIDSTTYTIYVAAKDKDSNYSNVATHTFTTKVQPEYTLVSKEHSGFKVSGRLSDNLPATSVVKWAVTDLASYNFNGGAENDNYWLNRNEALFPNILSKHYELNITPDTRTFVKDGLTYAWYEPITAGQPVVLLFAEYGEGSHSEWGEGHYSPLFGAANPNGYYRKETFVTTRPTTLAAKPSVLIDVRPSGKGTITISAPTDIEKFTYLILTTEQYNQALELLNNNASYLQWFVTSSLANELFGSYDGWGTHQIDTSKLNLKANTDYYLLITASGNSEGTSQSYVEATFALPPAAPETADNIIIAHRGGSKEAGVPDNSIASLKYAMGLGCYASETDIYWTKDNKIVVAHANSECKINGRYPWESTLAEIQAAGKLSNGETVPSLEDYIRAAMVKGSKTKICLDVKAITQPTSHDTEAVKACERACEIIKELEAEAWCEFICSGRTNITKNCAKYANAAGIAIGAMGDFSASQYKSYGYTWHNRDKGYGISESEVNTYLNAGLQVSVFTLDSDADWQLISSYWQKLKGITTNYPKKMLAKTR